MKRMGYLIGLLACLFVIYASYDYFFIHPPDEGDAMGSLLIVPAGMGGVFAIMGAVVYFMGLIWGNLDNEKLRAKVGTTNDTIMK